MSETPSQASDTPNVNDSPGELLARHREQLGIALNDAARALNLRPAVVEGLERDDYSEIPVATYRRGYLRAYARYLDIDERLVLDAYRTRFGEADVERKVTPVAVTKPPSRLGAWLFKLVTLLIIVALIAVTVMWWQSRGGSEPPRLDSSSSMDAPAEQDAEAELANDSAQEDTANLSNDSDDATDADQALDDMDGADDNGATDSNLAAQNATEDNSVDGSEPSSATAESAPLIDDDSADQATNLTATDSEENNTETTDTADTADTTDDNADADEGSTSSDSDINRLALTFNEQSWTEIIDADNQRVLVGLQEPGTSTTVEGQPPFRLTVGNVTGVELRYQGEEVDLTTRAGANNVARFTLGE